MEYWYYTAEESGGHRNDYGLFGTIEDAEEHARNNFEPEFDVGNPFNCDKKLITPNPMNPTIKIKSLTTPDEVTPERKPR